MMFYQDTIVTVVNGNKNPIRELESEKLNKGRKCKVILPFDTEYQFLIKNNCDTRIKLDIDIDGSNITNDGLVINSYQHYYLERFLNSPEKFKFVKKDNYQVSDPTNIENGIIKVKIYKENKKEKYMLSPYEYTTGFQNSIMRGMDYTSTNFDCNANKCLYSCSNIQSLNSNIGEVGATVGGSHSNQNFSTTEWNGDNGVDTEFVFILRGLDNNNNKKLEQYYKLKSELGL